MYLLLFCIWIILNGRFNLEIALFGIVICGLLYLFLYKFMDYSPKTEQRILRRIFDIIRYVFTLVMEIVKANISVIHLILSEREEIEPALVTFHTDLKTKTARAFLANAITLTPGTITVTLEDGEYMVHCLDKELAYGMDDTVFTRQLAAMEQADQALAAKQEAERSRKDEQ